MNGLLTYDELLAMLPSNAETHGIGYGDIEKALRLSRRTLYNEKNADGSLLIVWFYIGTAPYFKPTTVYEWYVNFTATKLQRMAA